jgi:hypothetical protein
MKTRDIQQKNKKSRARLANPADVASEAAITCPKRAKQTLNIQRSTLNGTAA